MLTTRTVKTLPIEQIKFDRLRTGMFEFIHCLRSDAMNSRVEMHSHQLSQFISVDIIRLFFPAVNS